MSQTGSPTWRATDSHSALGTASLLFFFSGSHLWLSGPPLRALMGTTTSCDAATSRPTLGCQADTVQACSQQCSKDSTRDVKSFHEVRGSSWEPSQSKKQLQEAQRVVDQTLQLLGLGLMVEWQDEQKRLIISEDAKTLELHGEAHRPMRIPMSQVVDLSFGGKPNVLVLRFSDALCREPLYLGFADEEQRLQVALTLKVLRARIP
ncbi:unnamed protein product [Durusdinium trenchii]|uniref:Uncharacterized protein n=1 Tax=Durusdinium trenchii TaxID=1381693 RepID=A0ABP0HRD4_9DINO